MYLDKESYKFKIGDTLPYFSLLATDGRMYSNQDFIDANVLVVIFTANHCPYAQAYEDRIIDLANNFLTAGVKFIAICSNDGEAYPADSYENMVERVEEKKFPFPYLHDESQEVARAFSSVCTPECFVFNAEKQLCYHGWVDDNHLVPEEVTRSDLKTAIESLVRGEKVPVSETPILGCTIKYRK